MATYTMTLDEVLRIPHYDLFEPHNFIDYPHVVSIICKEYGQQEIAYETPDLFKRKLNNELELRVGNYNKMLRSQLIEIDPFVTEYIEQMSDTEIIGTEGEKIHELFSGEHNNIENYDTKTNILENYTESGDKVYNKQDSGVEVKGTLYSESENKDTTVTEDFNQTENYSEEYNETNDNTIDKTGNETKDSTLQHNQTDRKWSENGSSKGHNLDVHSDTPQAMLFNVPNHYYGTGRADDYGEVVQDAEGNDVYRHYAETNPDTIDSADLKIGAGDSPWFNYASAADNKTGHDSYEKSGNETFSQSDTGKDTISSTANETQDLQKNGDKTSDTTTEYSKNIQTDESTAKNTNEHSKTDNHIDEDYKENTNGKRNTETNQQTGSVTSNILKDDTSKGTTRDNNRNEKTSDRSFMKGRRMMNPSKLLEDYRKTLTFNCDMWLLGELEPLFMQIF